MNEFKLVVVSPFGNYKRGAVICDPVIVENVLNKSHPMHSYSAHCRRVLCNKVVEQQYEPPAVQDEFPEPTENESDNVFFPEVKDVPPEGEPAGVIEQMAANNVAMDASLNANDEEIHLSSVKDQQENRPAKNQRRKR